MVMRKERDYSLDAIRGFCMWLIVMQHFCHRNPEFDLFRPDGVLYFFIDLFVMQTFFFLSGFFAKRVERGREIAFPSLLWPVIIIAVIMDVLLMAAEYPYTRPFWVAPYAMWFLVCLFYYRIFQQSYVKIPHLFGIACMTSLVVGFVPGIDKTFSIVQAVNWFPYFLLGFYCKKEHLDKVRSLRWWQTLLLAAMLIGGIGIFILYGLQFNRNSVMLSASNDALGLTWWEGLILKPAVFGISSLFLIVLLNTFPNKRGMWSYIGQNTMPVYIFHIALVLVMRVTDSVGFGLWPVPENTAPLYYGYLVALSFGVTILLTTRPFAWLYDFMFVKSYDLFIISVRKIWLPVGDRIERALLYIVPYRERRNSNG